MFTGIVEILGKVTSIVPLDSSESGGQGFSITIGNAAEILGDCHLGDSIAVNGKLSTHNCHYYFLARYVWLVEETWLRSSSLRSKIDQQ